MKRHLQLLLDRGARSEIFRNVLAADERLNRLHVVNVVDHEAESRHDHVAICDRLAVGPQLAYRHVGNIGEQGLNSRMIGEHPGTEQNDNFTHSGLQRLFVYIFLAISFGKRTTGLALLDQQSEPSVGFLIDDVQVITHPLLIPGLQGWHLSLFNEVVLDVVEDGGPSSLRLCRERQVLLHGFHKVLGLLQSQVKRSNADHQLL